tara:strand:- start:791 stop:1822 length:1032 start_codon:yes stop_codon:yes gene_type:complete
MIIIILFFLLLSVFLYALLGGADFGIGILELLSSKKNKELTKSNAYRVIGPVWEVNHVWLIIALVILWVGFPYFFNIMVLNLHIPMTLVLLGIIVRGVAFVFRHYDAVQDHSQKIYDRLFRWSSLFTPFFIGLCFGALFGGNINPPENYQTLSEFSFSELFIFPWLNWFSINVGLFFSALCAFNSSIFMIGESDFDQAKRYSRKAQFSNIFLAISGLWVFFSSIYTSQISLNYLFERTELIILFVLLIVVLQFLIWYFLAKLSKIMLRVMTAFLSLVLVAIPFTAISFQFQSNIEMFQFQYLRQTHFYLAISLIMGSIFIIPGLIHLLKTFGMIKIFDKQADN